MAKRSQEDWVNGAFGLLAEGGVEAIRVEPLAKRLGVSKGSFYWHFENRSALLSAVLEQWERLGTSAIIDRVDQQGSEPRARLRRLIEESCRAQDAENAAEVNIRAWAQHDPLASEAAARVDERRLDYVTAILIDAGLPRPLARRRTLMLYRVIIGGAAWQLANGPRPTRLEVDDLTNLVLGSERA